MKWFKFKSKGLPIFYKYARIKYDTHEKALAIKTVSIGLYQTGSFEIKGCSKPISKYNI